MADWHGTFADDRRLTLAWWLLMILGLLGAAVGVVVLAKPGDSLAALAVISGIFVLVDGIFEIVAALTRRVVNRGLVAVLGVLSAVVGILLIRHPIGGVAAVALLIGLWLIAVGVVRIIAAFEAAEHRWANVALGAVAVIAGIVIVANPHIGFATLALLTGIAFIAQGVGLFVLGWAVHRLGHEPTTPHGHAGAPA